MTDPTQAGAAPLRNVTEQEDRVLRNAIKRSATLIDSGRLAASPQPAEPDVLLQAVEALEDVTQTLDWHCHGCCRGISDRLLPSDEAVEKGIAAIASLRSCIGRGG